MFPGKYCLIIAVSQCSKDLGAHMNYPWIQWAYAFRSTALYAMEMFLRQQPRKHASSLAREVQRLSTNGAVSLSEDNI